MGNCEYLVSMPCCLKGNELSLNIIRDRIRVIVRLRLIQIVFRDWLTFTFLIAQKD